jgi:Effector-associated domain 1/CHAT domain
MAGKELTRDEVFALADAFPVGSAKTLLSLAGFPSSAVPETGYANTREFWTRISAELAAGVMPDGRAKILEAAHEWYPVNEKLAAFAAAAASASAPPVPAAGPGEPGAAVSVADGQGVQAGGNNLQINYFNYGGAQARETPPAGSAAAPPTSPARTAALRVLVIGASPLDPDLPHVRADREAHAIDRVAAPDRIRLEVVLGAEATDVQRVGTFRPDIVHFVCHGTADSLVFSDAAGEPDFVAAARVAQRLRFYRDDQGVRLRGIVLAACDGETLAPFFADVAGTVIAHRGKLADQCGVAFAEQFYTLLNARVLSTGGDGTGPDGAATGHPAVPDLAGIAREAAQLTAQYSAACDPVIANLIVLQDGG